MNFQLGKIVQTISVFTRTLNDDSFRLFVKDSLARYEQGDWGDLSENDKQQNIEALLAGDQLFGAYDYEDTTVYIITEWDRSVTTVLYSFEY